MRRDDYNRPAQVPALLKELARMRGEIVAPRNWLVDVGESFLRLATLVVFLAAGAWYDFNRIAPGPIMLAVIAAYLGSPIWRAVKQRNAEKQWEQGERDHLEKLAITLSRMPEAELLTRLAGMAKRGRITGVLDAAEALVEAERNPSALAAHDDDTHGGV